MGARCTSRSHGVGGTCEAIPHRYVSSRKIDKKLRDKVRRDFLRSLHGFSRRKREEAKKGLTPFWEKAMEVL